MWLNTNRNGLLQLIEIRQNDKHLVSAVIGVTPTLANARVEEVSHETVGLTRFGILFLEYAGPLEFSETFQLIAGQALKKIQY